MIRYMKTPHTQLAFTILPVVKTVFKAMHLIKNSYRYSIFEKNVIKGRYLDLPSNSNFFLFIWEYDDSEKSRGYGSFLKYLHPAVPGQAHPLRAPPPPVWK